MKNTAILTILLITTVATPVLAKDKTDVNSSTFAVQKMICSKMYVPATGAQSPTYQPGVDVNGNAVAPADLSAPPVANTPDYIEVPMTIDLAKKLGSAPVGAEMAMPVANLKLYKDGRVEYNGQDITSNAGEMCGFAKKSDAASDVNNIMPAAGQDQMTVAPSVTKPVSVGSQTPSGNYVPPIQPEEMAPQPGSVVPSSTTPPQKIIYKLQQGTAAKTLGQ